MQHALTEGRRPCPANDGAMAKVEIAGDDLLIELSVLDQLLAFHGSFRIPLAHITNAYVSTFEELELRYRLSGINLGFVKTVGIYTDPSGLIFCDITGKGDLLVLETRGERFPRIAVELPTGEDPNAVAHQIMGGAPDSGPVEG
jgi:hypothetical protein